MGYIAVVGGANVDIGGFPAGRMVAGDSNPGRVRMSMGGVGRNIACNAAHMGLNVELVTALGGDAYADLIRADCARTGVGLHHAQHFAQDATSTYLFIADEAGDMSVAVNDMAIHDKMTVERLRPEMDWLNGADLVVLEANLPKETSTFLAENLKPPVLADAVSAAKVEKLRDALPKLAAFKPNRIEAELLTGVTIQDAPSAKTAAEKLLDTGVKKVYLTLGTHGVCCAEEGRTLMIPAVTLPMKNATGAGDAFTAALAWAGCRNLPLEEAALAGMAAASIAVQSLQTVSDEMTEAMLLARMEQIRNQLRG